MPGVVVTASTFRAEAENEEVKKVTNPAAAKDSSHLGMTTSITSAPFLFGLCLASIARQTPGARTSPGEAGDEGHD